MNDYWDLDDILAEGELIRCELMESACAVDFLVSNDNRSMNQANGTSRSTQVIPIQRTNSRTANNQSNNQTTVTVSQLNQGSTLSIPLWLAINLAMYGTVRLMPHPMMSTRGIQELIADPRNVDFNERCKYFYRIGCKIADLSHSGSELHVTLKLVLASRYQEMVAKTSSIAVSNSNNQTVLPQQASIASNAFLATPSLEFARKLDTIELSILISKLKGLQGFSRFMKREGCMIEPPVHSTQQHASRNKSINQSIGGEKRMLERTASDLSGQKRSRT